MKKIISIILSPAMIAALVVPAMASEDENNVTDGIDALSETYVSSAFINFVNNCFAEDNEFTITDEQGCDKTLVLYNTIYDAYKAEEYGFIYDYINENNLKLSRTWTVHDSGNNNCTNCLMDDGLARAPTKYKIVS